MTRKLVIAGIGEVLWDVYPDAARFGGAPANFACHAAALGAEAWMASAVGVDELGRSALHTLEAAGVECGTIARDREHDTGQVLVTLDSSGRASYEFAADSAWDHLEWSATLESLARRCDAVCFGTLGQRSPISRATIQRFVRTTPPRVLRMFDVNLRRHFFDQGVIHTSLQIASAVKLNEEELPKVAELCQIGASTPRQMLREIVERYDLRLAALTCGAEGALLIAGDEESTCPAVPAKVVDTVGAGDSFTATLVPDFLRGLPLAEINRHANAVASFVCSQPGAVMKLPDYLMQGVFRL
ncbi:MAG TPA: carbohydrate kinase [Gemmatimonadaceae bacterium]|jgi:fructokinase